MATKAKTAGFSVGTKMTASEQKAQSAYSKAVQTKAAVAPVQNALEASINQQSAANHYSNAPSLTAAQAPTQAQAQAISSGSPQAVQEATQAAQQTALGDAISQQPGQEQTVYAQEPVAAASAAAGVAAAPEAVLPAKPVFNAKGDKSWNGATGLSQEAVDWLNAGADSTYFDDVNASKKTFDGFVNDITTQRANGSTDRLAALRRLGYNYNETSKTGSWNDDDLTTARGGAISDMGYDYGARGLLHSSEYARRLTDAQNQYQDQANAIVSAGDRFNTSLTAQQANAQAELADQNLAAIRQAVQRKAAAEGALN